MNKFGCGCTTFKELVSCESFSSDSGDLDTNKCYMYQKTRGKRHKLCIGQNKKHRRWKLTAPIDQNINPQENELDKTETDMVILDYPHSQTSILDSIPLRKNLQQSSKGVLESIPQRKNQYPLKVFTVNSPGYSNDGNKLTQKVDDCENITAHLPDENIVEVPSLNDQHSELQPKLSNGELEKKKKNQTHN